MNAEAIDKSLETVQRLFRIGAFTFGGGLAMLPLIEREVVDVRGWVGKDEILDIVALSQSVPGAIAVNSSILSACG